jgi:hypothetical protein
MEENRKFYIKQTKKIRKTASSIYSELKMEEKQKILYKAK